MEKGYYGLRFTFDGKAVEDTVYVKGTALMHRVSFVTQRSKRLDNSKIGKIGWNSWDPTDTIQGKTIVEFVSGRGNDIFHLLRDFERGPEGEILPGSIAEISCC